MQVGTSFRTRDANLKTKVRPVTQTMKPDAVIQFSNLDLTPLDPFKSEPLNKLKSSRLQMFFKIGSVNNFAIFRGKHLRWGLFIIKLQV